MDTSEMRGDFSKKRTAEEIPAGDMDEDVESLELSAFHIMRDMGCAPTTWTNEEIGVLGSNVVASIFCKNKLQEKAARFGLLPGFAADAAEGWDLNDPAGRRSRSG